MKSTLDLAHVDLTRQELLWLWLRRNKLKCADIARALDVTSTTISEWFDSERIPEWRHAMLVKFGIPPEILPAPVNIAPGPKKKA